LNVVDRVAINNEPTCENTIRLLKPDYYAKGSEFNKSKSDYTGKIDNEISAIEEIGGQMIFTEDIVFSSTNLINRFLSNRSEELHEFFNLFTERYSIQDIFEVLDKMADLKVLVVGDTILDDYQYCEVIGKSSKDPVLALKYKSNDIFVGGVAAVANHVAGLAGKVTLCSTLGDDNFRKDQIFNGLDPKITPYFTIKPSSPTLTKKRFLDGYTFNKLFEIYIMDDTSLPEELDADFCEKVKEQLSNHDLIIVADFGHGTISKRMIHNLTQNAKFLAVNTQANAGNRGFHTISSYPRADFVSLAEHEIRLETRMMKGPVRPMMDELAEKLCCKYFIVTRGRHGSVVRGEKGAFVASPSLSVNVVDRVGAGDAFFSIAALAAVLGADEEMIGFLGNAVGSMAVEMIGNQKSIDKMVLKKYITSLLK
jgi:rfaE bifunctional protein kinase chain/domain